jgi:membrane protease subunit (stomatin/prohibitin family)
MWVAPQTIKRGHAQPKAMPVKHAGQTQQVKQQSNMTQHDTCHTLSQKNVFIFLLGAGTTLVERSAAAAAAWCVPVMLVLHCVCVCVCV